LQHTVEFLETIGHNARIPLGQLQQCLCVSAGDASFDHGGDPG
jgi:hypothetical protein